jgi:RimJ/RimL family protein N-acetyltransferase
MSKAINTERLILRPIHLGDAADVVAGVSSLAVSRWLTLVPHPYDVTDATDFIERNEGLFPQVCAIEHDGRLIGVIGIRRELGYWLSETAHGNGFIYEAARELIADAFADPDREEISSGHFVGNNKSRRILASLGFIQGAKEKATPLSTGEEVVVQKMTLSRAAWEAMK